MEQLLMKIGKTSNISPEDIQQYINNTTDTTPIDNDDDHRSLSSSTCSQTHQQPSSPFAGTMDTRPPDTHMEEQLESVKEGKYAYVGSSSGVYMLKQLFPKETQDNSMDQVPNSCTLVQANEEDDLMVARFGHKSTLHNTCPGMCTPNHSSPSSWQLPPKPVVDRLVEMYFTKMNDYLPIIDEEEFMDMYRKGGDAVSKPLLITICRVTIRMLPETDPVVQEYHLDRTTMFWDFVRQMESNYELDFMEPQIECIQILLLNSANADRWCPKSTDWLATSIAVKMAQDLGLHRSNTTKWTAPPRLVEARKRLWWCAYIVDRWVCASLGRPLTVNDADCDLEYPVIGEHGKYTAFVSIIKLSGLLGDVLRAICSPRAQSLGNQGQRLARILEQLDQALSSWKQSLPSSLWLSDIEMQCIHQHQVSPALDAKINNGAGQLRILYIAVQLLSKRPSIFLGPDHTSCSTSSTVVVPQECLDAVVNVLDIFYAIEFPSLLYVGWSLSSYGLSQTLMVIFLNHRNENTLVVTEAKRQAETFKRYYRSLEDHFIERHLLTFLDAISKMIEEDDSSEKPVGQTSTSLCGASSGMDWHDMMDLIGNYNCT
ncbi:fungal-specific transcription factor domain-containing protein [Chlamydoabsidia padenii]|nr:fungal-specific transcription factor domain-containing protein [Chlamydoabsidia padenii]